MSIVAFIQDFFYINMLFYCFKTPALPFMSVPRNAFIILRVNRFHRSNVI